MTVTVWKYPLDVIEEQVLHLPEGAELLQVNMQGSNPQLWALVNPEAPLKNRTIAIHGTGHWILDGKLKHISTFHFSGEGIPYVFHAFERIED